VEFNITYNYFTSLWNVIHIIFTLHHSGIQYKLLLYIPVHVNACFIYIASDLEMYTSSTYFGPNGHVS